MEKCKNNYNIAIVLDNSVSEEANVKKVRSFVKKIASSFTLDEDGSGQGVTSFSLAVFNFGLSLHVAMGKASSLAEFRYFLDTLQFTAVQNSVIDYDQLFAREEGRGFTSSSPSSSITSNVLLTVQDYGSTHSLSFSNMVSAVEETTKVCYLML